MRSLLAALALLTLGTSAMADGPRNHHRHDRDLRGIERPNRVDLGPRPFFLADDMAESPLKQQL